ncbi:aliphatic sulfonate ABC transporter substrate-binding protein [Marmoricola sp. RAF53]|uniref:aliphatic sulfonate ABC transporter substrate-binding protein n=1 Tax=Marmoricola sp. RAF53 TaxID=3233059 RepID=UPI003F963ED9
MSRRFTRLVAAAGTAALSLALVACGSSGGDAKVGGAADGAHPEWKKLTFTVGEQSDGIKTLAATSGAFDDASYKIKFAKFEYGPPLVAAASTGDIDLGMVGSVPPIAGAAKDLGFKVIGLELPESPDKALENIIVPKGSTAKSLKDLKGKRIAVPQGSSAHGLLLNALKAEGLTPQDVKIVYLDPKSGAAAFDSGKVDAWSIWNPQGEFALQKGAKVLVPGVPPVDPGSQYYVGSSKSLDDKVRRAALTDLLQRIGKAYAWGNAHPDKHAEAIATDSGIPLEQATASEPVWRFTLGYVDDAHVQAGQQLADNFFEAGEIAKKVDFANVVDNLLTPDYDPTETN